jgi:hypothetical protein
LIILLVPLTAQSIVLFSFSLFLGSATLPFYL